MVILSACGNIEHYTYLLKHKPIYKILLTNPKYTPLICNAMKDIASSDVFLNDITFIVRELKKEIETSDIIIEIQSQHDYYLDSDYITPHPLDNYRIGTYNRTIPNRYWQLGERIILWND